jgi:hypoxanthine phosphoribosyltransferase
MYRWPSRRPLTPAAGQQDGVLRNIHRCPAGKEGQSLVVALQDCQRIQWERQGQTRMQSYDYAHRQGVKEISWPGFAELSATLVERLAAEHVQVVVGIARAGLFPATLVACGLRCEFYPVRITRRVNDRVAYERPAWKVDVSPEVRGQTVAVIDEIADTGETLALVARRARALGAARVIAASLVSHSWADPAPDLAALTTDALVLFPWDRQVYVEGRWQVHPELAEAIAIQSKGEQNTP